jgi:hypothetical protein
LRQISRFLARGKSENLELTPNSAIVSPHSAQCGAMVMSIQSTGLSEWEVGPLVVKPKIAWKMLACSNTRGYELLNSGELESYLDGRSRKITVESIRQYIARRVKPVINPPRRSKPIARPRAEERIHHEP